MTDSAVSAHSADLEALVRDVDHRLVESWLVTPNLLDASAGFE